MNLISILQDWRPNSYLVVRKIRIQFLVFCILALCSQIAQASAYPAKVVRIIDGDTIVVLDSNNRQHRIRLAGIDAPEKKQAFGNVSRQNLANISFGQLALVDTYKLDRYGRELAVVYVNKIDIGLFQIKSGLAWHYKKYAHEQAPSERIEYASSELDAKRGKKGIWSDVHAVEPWDFRRKK